MIRVRPWLLIDKYDETNDLALLHAMGIGAMLQLAALVVQPNIEHIYLPVEDGMPLDADLLRQGIDTVRTCQDAGKTVLIACEAGISRAPTFAIAALKEIEAISLVDATRFVRRLHQDSAPHPILWESLCAFFQEQHDYRTVLRASHE